MRCGPTAPHHKPHARTAPLPLTRRSSCDVCPIPALCVCACACAQVLSQYAAIVPHVTLSGPTSFAPIIDKAVDTVRKTGQYHILLIVADGQVTSKRQTREALVRASHFALSVIIVGVGDGPWDEMELLDDGLEERVFDNLQFVDFTKLCGMYAENPDVAFALNATMELPEQYQTIKKLGLL
jgi:E3 ubiquitin-protein ligase RGLG